MFKVNNKDTRTYLWYSTGFWISPYLRINCFITDFTSKNVDHNFHALNHERLASISLKYLRLFLLFITLFVSTLVNVQSVQYPLLNELQILTRSTCAYQNQSKRWIYPKNPWLCVYGIQTVDSFVNLICSWYPAKLFRN